MASFGSRCDFASQVKCLARSSRWDILHARSLRRASSLRLCASLRLCVKRSFCHSIDGRFLLGSRQFVVSTEGPDTGSRRLGHSHRILQDPCAGCPIESIRHKCLKEPLPKKKSDVPRSVRPSRGASAHARHGRQRRRQCPGGARCRVSRGWPWTRDPGKPSLAAFRPRRWGPFIDKNFSSAREMSSCLQP